MSQENAEIVQRAFEAWNRGDIEAYLAYLSSDVEAVPVGAALEGEVCRGHNEARAWWQAHSEIWETFCCAPRRSSRSAKSFWSLATGRRLDAAA